VSLPHFKVVGHRINPAGGIHEILAGHPLSARRKIKKLPNIPKHYGKANLMSACQIK